MSRPMIGMSERGFRRGPEEPAKWEDVEKFFKANSPHRYEAMLKLGEREQQLFKEQMTRQYMMVRSLERDDRELADIRKRQFRIEDDIFAARLALIGSPAASEAEREEQRDTLRGLIKQRVQARLEERAARIERAKKLLEQEEQRLTKDRTKVDEAVAREFELESKSVGLMRRPGEMRRPTGKWPGNDDAGKRPHDRGQ